MVYLAFYKSSSPTATAWDKTIAFLDGSMYSHVELAVKREDDSYDCYSSSNRDDGIRYKNMKLDPEKWDLVPVDVSSRTVVDKYLENKGCKYDYLGLLATKIKFMKGFKKRWYCSEFCAYVLGYKDYHNYGVKRLFYKVSKGV